MDSDAILLASLTVENKASLGTLAPPAYSGILAARGYPVALTTEATIAPAVTDAEVVWSYEAEGYRDGNGEPGICTVDERDGTVTPGAQSAWGDACDVIATANVPGYDSKRVTVRLPVHDVFDSVEWASFPTSGEVGGSVDLSGVGDGPSVLPATNGVDYTVTVVSGDCAYNNAKVLSFTGLTTCVVSVTASYPAGHRFDTVGTFSVTPDPGTIAVAGDNWGSYNPVSIGAGTVSAPSIGATTPTPVDTAYESLTPLVCTATNAGVVEGLDDDETCEVQLTLSKVGYHDRTHTYSFTIQKGTITATDWGSYNAVAVGGGATDAPTATFTPTDATKTYSSLTGSICTVDPSTGAVTGLDDDACQIKLVLSKDSYDNLEHTYSIAVAKGTIAVAGNTADDKWGSYGTVTVGGGTVTAPDIGATTPATTKGYASLTSAVCTSTAAGVVEGLDDGNCRISLTLQADNYDDLVYTYDFDVQPGTITVSGTTTQDKWGSYGTVTVGGGAQSAPAIGTVSPSGAAKTYSSLTGTVCTVDSVGAVTGIDDGSCQIKLVLSTDGHSDLPHTYSFTVQAGTIAVSGADTAAKWGSYDPVRVGAGATSPPTIGSVTPGDGDQDLHRGVRVRAAAPSAIPVR